MTSNPVVSSSVPNVGVIYVPVGGQIIREQKYIRKKFVTCWQTNHSTIAREIEELPAIRPSFP